MCSSAYSVPSDPLAGFRGPTSKDRAWEKKGEKWEGREGEGGKGRGRGRVTPVPDWESEKVATLSFRCRLNSQYVRSGLRSWTVPQARSSGQCESSVAVTAECSWHHASWNVS